MRSTPEVKAHLEPGQLSLITAAQIQRFIQVEKKVGNPLSVERKSRCSRNVWVYPDRISP